MKFAMPIRRQILADLRTILIDPKIDYWENALMRQAARGRGWLIDSIVTEPCGYRKYPQRNSKRKKRKRR